MMFGDMVPIGHPVWELCITLKEISDILCAISLQPECYVLIGAGRHLLRLRYKSKNRIKNHVRF